MPTFPGESAQYRNARDELLLQEIELRRQMEVVAAARRALPPGGVTPEDYAFDELDHSGGVVQVRLSELFADGTSSLAVYNYMFPRHSHDSRPGPATGETAALPLAEGPCPSCTALIDELDASEPHVAPHANLVVVAKTPIGRLAAFGRERGWRHIRLLSSAGNTFARDYNGESGAEQQPMMNVFHREDGVIRHFWGSELLYAATEPGQDSRHLGTIESFWNLFDLMPGGRGAEWEEQLDYRCH